MMTPNVMCKRCKKRSHPPEHETCLDCAAELNGELEKLRGYAKAALTGLLAPAVYRKCIHSASDSWAIAEAMLEEEKACMKRRREREGW